MPSPLGIHRRSSPTVAILLGTVGLASVLTYQAWDAARSHEATARRAMRDYAAFAAWEFSLSAKEDLNSALISIFFPINYKEPLQPGERLARPAILAHAKTEKLLCPDDTRWFFRLDLPSGKLLVDGQPPSAEMQRWVRDTVLVDLKRYKKEYIYSTVAGTIDGAPCSIAYQVKFDSDWKPAAVYGFQLCLRALAEPVFAKTMKSARLLPPALTDHAPNDSLMSVTLRDGAGHQIWRTRHQFPAQYAGSVGVDHFGGLITEVRLNPHYAEKLVIGGLPSSKVPFLLVVLALTVGLALTGIHQLRREDQLARLRSDFIASVSHELRTPLAQLRMFAETLRLGRVRSEHERQRSLEIVDQEARRLSHLVENILQFSRAERQAITLCPQDEVLAPHLRAGVELFDPIARTRGVRVSLTTDESIRCRVDAGALRQILLNLLDNAVKYGPAGQEVRVTLDRAPGGESARIVVEDQGAGIPRERRDQVWEPFYRLDRDASSAVAGSGIGLSVVRELARRQGGTARIEDSRAGTRFVVDLPLCSTAGGALARGAERTAGATV